MFGELILMTMVVTSQDPSASSRITARGIYGGVPTQILDRGQTLPGMGINAVWMGSGSLSPARVALLREQGAKVFAEFNTMHEAGYLKDHPEAAPIGPDGKQAQAPEGWQGVCPTHPGYRAARMAAFEATLRDHDIDGIWLDYHHAQAAWERAEPILQDTCFCGVCLAQFQRQTGRVLPEGERAVQSAALLGPLREEWVAWRCSVFTDWVRQFDEIRDRVRPQALLGTFHCPWTDQERAGALREKLAIDLKAQAQYINVFSPMPYHARFGHADDPAWISRQTAWLGEFLGVEGLPGEKWKIWPIVQLSDWGENVPAGQVSEVLDHGTRAPATGVMVFAWGSLHPQWEKVEALGKFYGSISK